MNAMDFSANHQFLEIVPHQMWIYNTPFRFLGVNIGARMTVIRLERGGLFLHSPVEWTEDIKKGLNSLGPVLFIVSPNHMHHLFMADYQEVYPEVRLYASPGLREKRKDIKFFGILQDKAEEAWQSELDQMIFYGHPLSQEVIFYHFKSRTLLLADLMMNFDTKKSLLTKIVTKTLGIYGGPVFPVASQLSLTEQAEAKISAKRILQWHFERIILSHGNIIENNGKEAFQQAFGGLLEKEN